MSWKRFYYTWKWRLKGFLNSQGGDTVTRALISTNIGVYFAWKLLNPRFMWDHFIMNEYNTLYRKRYYTIFTSAISHQDAVHLFFNMIGLWFFGRPIEAFIGGARLLGLYLTGAAGGFAAIYYKALNGRYRQQIPSVLGASAATSAIFAYFVCGNPWQPVLFFFVPMPAIVAGLVIFLLGARGHDGYISHTGHLGGAVAGAHARIGRASCNLGGGGRPVRRR